MDAILAGGFVWIMLCILSAIFGIYWLLLPFFLLSALRRIELRVVEIIKLDKCALQESADHHRRTNQLLEWIGERPINELIEAQERDITSRVPDRNPE
jgi:hypothetical protein